MEKHCESKKRFGKEENGEAARQEILEGLIRDSGEKAYQFAYSLAGNCDEAHDLVQEALYRVMQAWKRYEAGKPLETWFMSILRNAFIDGRRSYERKHAVSLDCPIDADDRSGYADVIADKAESIPTSLERKETASLARRALGRMSQEQREVLTLCDMDGLRYEEVATALRIPEGTVRSRVFRARQTFRGIWPQLETVA
jgi:RNA polymerase sigma-70 factor (ECF subfamily)